VQQVVVPVVDRVSADDVELAALVAGAGLVYLSGGNPPFLARTLRGTRVWSAIEEAWRGGAALAGCSAGAMALTTQVPDIRHPLRDAEEGLGAVPGLSVLPHFDRFAGRLPDMVLRRLSNPPEGIVAVGIDEDTALIRGLDTEDGADGEWEVVGRQSAWVLGPDGRHEYPTGSRLSF
jgi:cyanophycinase-like exopeptidase